MTQFIIRDKEAGNVISRHETMADALDALYTFEETDKKEGTFTEDFYEIVKEVVRVKVDHFSVQVKYTGKFEDYSIGEFADKAYYRIYHGVDGFDYQDEMDEDDARKIDRIYSVENAYPCNKIAVVRWALINIQEEEEA